LHALYATVTYAAENLMNLMIHQNDPDQLQLHSLMFDELEHFHLLDTDSLRQTASSVDRLHALSFQIIGAALKDHQKFVLSDAQEHQAMLANAAKYLLKRADGKYRSGNTYSKRFDGGTH